MSETTEKFTSISDDTQQFFNNVLQRINVPYSLKYYLVAANRQKQVVKMNKLNELMNFVTGYDAVVSINDTLFEQLDDDNVKEILLRQELDKLAVDIESGRVRTIRPDMTTFSGIIKKFGWQSVARANQLDELASSQQQDQLTEEFLSQSNLDN